MEVSIIIPCNGISENIKNNVKSWQQLSKSVTIVDSYPACEILKEFCNTHKISYVIFNWRGGYPKKRQWALDNLSLDHKWVLFLDDDEFVPEVFVNYLSNLTESSNIDGYEVLYDNWFLGRKLKYGIPMRKLVLIKHGCGSFQDLQEQSWSKFDMEVHEHFICKSHVKIFPKRLEHRQIVSFAKLTEKHLHYAEWEVSRIRQKSNLDGSTIRQKIKNRFITSAYFSIAYFFYHYFVKLGLLDGKQGLLYSILKLHYFALIASKFNEK